MNLRKVPSRSQPIAISMDGRRAASRVARPSMPYLATVAADQHDEARPPARRSGNDCRRAARRGSQPTIAVKSPRSGATPEAMAIAMLERQRDDGDGQAGESIGAQTGKVIALAPDGHDLGHEELCKARPPRHFDPGCTHPWLASLHPARRLLRGGCLASPEWLGTSSPISSTPARSSASTTLMRLSTRPRTLPSLASMRWIGGERNARQLGQRTLVDPEHGARGAHLGRGYHGLLRYRNRELMSQNIILLLPAWA